MVRRLLSVLLVIAGVIAGVVGLAAARGMADGGGHVDGRSAAGSSDVTPVRTSDPVPVASGGTVEQRIALAVKGGPISLGQDKVDVVLRRIPGTRRYEGHASVDVVDARGTLAGWSVQATVQLPATLRHGVVHLRPSRPAVVDGADSGLLAGRRASAKDGQPVILGSASAGDGGGSYRVGTAVELTAGNVGSLPDGITIGLVPHLV